MRHGRDLWDNAARTWSGSTWSRRTSTGSTSLGTLTIPATSWWPQARCSTGPTRSWSTTGAARGLPDQRNENTVLHHADNAVIAEFDLLGTHEGSCAASSRRAELPLPHVRALPVRAGRRPDRLASASTSTRRRSRSSCSATAASRRDAPAACWRRRRWRPGRRLPSARRSARRSGTCGPSAPGTTPTCSSALLRQRRAGPDQGRGTAAWHARHLRERGHGEGAVRSRGLRAPQRGPLHCPLLPPRRGLPSLITADPIVNAVDDEFSYRITDLRITRRYPPVAAADMPRRTAVVREAWTAPG